MEDEHLHFVGKVAQKALIERDGKVLLARAKGDDFWDIPGGRIHSGEKPADAVAREVREELGLEIVVGKPFYVDLIVARKVPEERYFVCFHVTLADPTQEPSFPTDEAAEAYWLSRDEVETLPMYEACRRAARAHFNETVS